MASADEMTVKEAFELAVHGVAAKSANLGPDAWAAEVAEYAVALYTAYPGINRLILEWGRPVRIPGVIQSIQNPFVNRDGQERQLARVTFKPDRTKLAADEQNFWVDISSEQGQRLVDRLMGLTGQHCTVVKKSRYTVKNGERQKDDAGRDDSHPYLVDVITGDGSSFSSAPDDDDETGSGSAGPSARTTEAPRRASPPPAKKAAATKKAAAKKAAAPQAAAPAPAPAPAPAQGGGDNVPNGFDNMEEAMAMRAQINAALKALDTDQQVAARQWMQSEGLAWPLAKVRAQALLDRLGRFGAPEAEVEVEEPEPEEDVAVAEVTYEGDEEDEAADDGLSEDGW